MGGSYRARATVEGNASSQVRTNGPAGTRSHTGAIAGPTGRSVFLEDRLHFRFAAVFGEPRRKSLVSGDGCATIFNTDEVMLRAMPGTEDRPVVAQQGSLCMGKTPVGGQTDSTHQETVKQCPCCGYVWRTREGLLADPGLALAGYQVNFDDLLLGFFLFSHLACGSTIAVPAGRFRDLYDGPVYEDRATGTQECPTYCLRKDELGPCPAKCECAYVREILQIVRHWPKEAASTGDASH
jgi:hypothetical protein